MPDFDPDFAAPADFARFYRSLGMQVVPAFMPVADGQWKRPLLTNWREFQTMLVPDAQFQRWYGSTGQYRLHRNMGFLTGVPTPEGELYWILDLDFQKGPEARQWLEKILHLHNNGMGFGTPLLRTGGGGFQYLFKASPGWRPPTGKTPIGVDIRGVGGFAMLAPSMHLSGNPYGYVNGQAPWEAEIEESPKWLEDAVDELLAQHHHTGPHEPRPDAQYPVSPSGKLLDGREDKMASLIWARLIDLRRDAPMPPGEQDLLDAYATYRHTVKSRIVDPDADQDELLERENRGLSLFRQKWGYAMAKWDDEIAEAAKTPNPKEIAASAPQSPADGPDATGGAPPPFDFGGWHGDIPEPRPWLYGDILMRGAVTAVASPPGTGKTALSMQLAVAVGLDLTLGPWEPQPGGGGRVAIFNGEEPTDELTRRFLAACYEAGADPAAASQRVAYRSSQDAPLRLCKLDSYGAFQRSPDVDLLKAAIIEQEVKLVMLDPLIEFYDGIDESDNSQIKLVGQILREIATDCDCAVMIFHHTKKSDNADTAAGDMNALRGGGALIGQARFVFTLFTMSERDAERLDVEPHRRTYFCRWDGAKANMAPVSGEVWFERLGVGLDNASDIRPADVIGILRHTRFGVAASDGSPVSERASPIRESRRQARRMEVKAELAEKMIDVVARTLMEAGAVSKATAIFTNELIRLLDRDEIEAGRDRATELLLQIVKDGTEYADKKIGRFKYKRGPNMSMRWYVY